MPRSKRLLTDERSNILVYMTGNYNETCVCLKDWSLSRLWGTGHGGDGFLKFQDAEEITSIELADAFEQMWQKKRSVPKC